MQRFYGGDPASWLDMSVRLFVLYVGEIDRIKAQETLSLINSISLGNGLMKDHDYHRITNRLELAANGGKREKSVHATPDMLAEIGIGQEKVKRNG